MQPHDVLGVGPGASAREVRGAFRRLAAAHHPDRGGDPALFRAGLDAYRRLTAGAVPPGATVAAGDANVVFHRRPRGLRRLTGRRSRPRRHLR